MGERLLIGLECVFFSLRGFCGGLQRIPPFYRVIEYSILAGIRKRRATCLPVAFREKRTRRTMA